MRLRSFTKQNSEEFPVTIDFSKNMDTGEVISSQTISAVDNTETDATADVLESPQNDGAQAALVQVKAGTEALSPYKITFVAVTDAGNTWEYDILMVIKEK